MPFVVRIQSADTSTKDTEIFGEMDLWCEGWGRVDIAHVSPGGGKGETIPWTRWAASHGYQS